MSHAVERINTPEPHILVTIYEDFDVATEHEQYQQKVMDELNASETSLTLVIDVTRGGQSFEGLLSATKKNVDAKDNSPFKHPNAKRVILVTDSNLLKASMEGYVKLGVLDNFHVVGSLDEAMSYIY